MLGVIVTIMLKDQWLRAARVHDSQGDVHLQTARSVDFRIG